MAFHVFAGAEETTAHPEIRRIGISDVFDALARGWADFWEQPSHLAFLFVIYPVVGIVLMYATSDSGALQLAFPIMAGFALLGPLAAVGLYEISRRRERGMDTSWRHAFEVVNSPAMPSIFGVGGLLLFLFISWIYSAQLIYMTFFGAAPPESMGGFLTELFTTTHGWGMIIVGNLVGLIFALIVLTSTVVALPLLVDRDCGAYLAVSTSARAVLANPGPMLFWGFIVAVALFIGSIPLFVGLAIIVPVLGHATWHLYRRTIAMQPGTADTPLHG